MSRPFTWSAAEEAKLRKLWESGASSVEIETRFDGRYTACAIRQKARKLNLTQRKGGYTHVAGRKPAAVVATPVARPISLAPVPPPRSA